MIYCFIVLLLITNTFSGGAQHIHQNVGKLSRHEKMSDKNMFRGRRKLQTCISPRDEMDCADFDNSTPTFCPGNPGCCWYNVNNVEDTQQTIEGIPNSEEYANNCYSFGDGEARRCFCGPSKKYQVRTDSPTPLLTEAPSILNSNTSVPKPFGGDNATRSLMPSYGGNNSTNSPAPSAYAGYNVTSFPSQAPTVNTTSFPSSSAPSVYGGNNDTSFPTQTPTVNTTSFPSTLIPSAYAGYNDTNFTAQTPNVNDTSLPTTSIDDGQNSTRLPTASGSGRVTTTSPVESPPLSEHVKPPPPPKQCIEPGGEIPYDPIKLCDPKACCSQKCDCVAVCRCLP